MKKEMKNFIFITVLILISTLAIDAKSTKEPFAAYQKDSTWYIIDINKQEIFHSSKISELRGYSEGLFRVTMKSTPTKSYWEFLHKDGSLAFKPNVVVIDDFHDGMALSARKNMWAKSLQILGYYDKNGNEAVKHKYDDATYFSEGLAYVHNKEISGFINKKGEMVIPLKDRAANPFSEGLAPVNTKEFKVGFIDTTGKLVIDYKFDEAQPFSEGKCAVHVDGHFAFIDKKGNMLVQPTYDFAHSFHENYAFVGMAEDRAKYAHPKWGFIDTTGKLVCELKYKFVHDFSEGLAGVLTQNDKWGFIDYKDSLVVPDKYDAVYSFKDDLAWAEIRSENKCGFINKKGEWVIVFDNPQKVFDLRWNKRVK